MRHPNLRAICEQQQQPRRI
uniref:Uncharacterized protein n=1 Tax=Arundo donax TaxID=35708 RepID=A0A0A8ZNJ7_ARUDO